MLVKFSKRPVAHILSKQGDWKRGSLVAAWERIAYAMGDGTRVTIASPKPVDIRLVVLSPKAWPAKAPRIEKLSHGGWAVDIDHDGNHDLALLRPKPGCEIKAAGDSCTLATPLINIGGSWRLIQWLEESMGT